MNEQPPIDCEQLKNHCRRKNGALERTRTFTPLGAQPSQGCVSTNSTTSAPEGRITCKIVLVFTSGFFDLFDFTLCG